jgi:hypothetical protein
MAASTASMRPSLAVACRQHSAQTASCATCLAAVRFRENRYTTRRAVTWTDSVAGSRSKVAEGEMLRAITRTVLLLRPPSLS